MKKILTKLKGLIPSKRKLIQLYSALLFNANIRGFKNGEIYKGATKSVCAPGLNCYSCPGAVGACPLGSLQNALGASEHRTPFYVIGILLLYGLLLGRFICGFLCPFGLIQELLYKIKTPKLKKSRVTKALSYLKYVILVFFTIIVPILYGLRKMPLPGFCKYICPAGTLEGAIGLLTNKLNEGELSRLGPLFTWKFAILVGIILGSIFIFRMFCRFLCPLGAIYGLFNHFSVFGIKLDKEKCTSCGLCVNKCKMDIRHVNDHECINCGECIDVCPTNAISWKGSKIFLPPDEIAFAGVTDSSTDEDKRIYEAEQKEIKERNEKIKKRNKIIKIVVACVMVLFLAFAIVYYNVLEPMWNERNANDPTVNNPIVNNPITNPGTQDSGNQAVKPGTPDSGNNTQNSTPGGTVDSGTPDKPKPTLGNTVGSLCYGYDLKVFDENGLTGATFNPANNPGKITIINFWGTWCSGCVKELPYFDRIAKEYKDKVTVVAVHTDRDFGTAAEYISTTQGYNGLYKDGEMIFVKDEKIDPNGNKFSKEIYFDALGGRDAYPITIILDENGVIIASNKKEMTYEELKAIVDNQLSK